MRVLVVGAGFSGATTARLLAEAGWCVDAVEKRPGPGGHCWTEIDAETGVMVHACGPHIFHTSTEEVWRFVNKYAELRPYLHTVRARAGGEIYPLPVTLQTINQFFRKSLGPAEARAFVEAKRVKLDHPPRNFAEQAVSMFGHELYEAFFKGYTEKQWGRSPTMLPASVLKRLPFRFNYDQNYFSDRYQGIPVEGYSALVGNILDHPNIDVAYGVGFSGSTPRHDYQHVVYTGPLDAWFDYGFGRLPYRTLKFENSVVDGDYQGCVCVNYCDLDVPYTRITEHKHFADASAFEKSVISKEYSREAGPGDEPYYPVRLAEDEAVYNKYKAAALVTRGVTFVGRLATFQYIDMDKSIAKAMHAAHSIHRAWQAGEDLPTFLEEN